MANKVTGTYNEPSDALYREIFWLVSDHLGTPRLIAERTGKLEGVKRSDYLPYGESANALGGRATTQGYAGESVRQGFTGYEEDSETGLDFAQARYLSSTQGRFISVDPLMASAATGEPQSWNRYVYVSNNPLNLTDPTGLLQKPPVVSTITADHVRSDSQTIDGADDAPPQDPPQKSPPDPCKPETLTLGNGKQKSVREEGCGNGSLITADVTVVAGAAAIAVPAASEAITGITLTTSASAIAEIVGGVSLGTSVAGVAGIAAGVVICAGLLNAIDNPRPATARGPGGVGISCTAGPQAFPQSIPRVPPILGDGVRCFYRGQNENYCTYQCYIGTTPVQKLHTSIPSPN